MAESVTPPTSEHVRFRYAAIVLFAVCIAIVLAIAMRVFQHQPLGSKRFSHDLWMNVMTRHECVDDLLASRILLGKSKEAVAKILGHPEEKDSAADVYLPSKHTAEIWRYEMNREASHDFIERLELLVEYDSVGVCIDGSIFAH